MQIIKNALQRRANETILLTVMLLLFVAWIAAEQSNYPIVLMSTLAAFVMWSLSKQHVRDPQVVLRMLKHDLKIGSRLITIAVVTGIAQLILFWAIPFYYLFDLDVPIEFLLQNTDTLSLVISFLGIGGFFAYTYFKMRRDRDRLLHYWSMNAVGFGTIFFFLPISSAPLLRNVLFLFSILLFALFLVANWYFRKLESLRRVAILAVTGLLISNGLVFATGVTTRDMEIMTSEMLPIFQSGIIHLRALAVKLSEQFTTTRPLDELFFVTDDSGRKLTVDWKSLEEFRTRLRRIQESSEEELAEFIMHSEAATNVLDGIRSHSYGLGAFMSHAYFLVIKINEGQVALLGRSLGNAILFFRLVAGETNVTPSILATSAEVFSISKETLSLWQDFPLYQLSLRLGIADPKEPEKTLRSFEDLAVDIRATALAVNSTSGRATLRYSDKSTDEYTLTLTLSHPSSLELKAVTVYVLPETVWKVRDNYLSSKDLSANPTLVFGVERLAASSDTVNSLVVKVRIGGEVDFEFYLIVPLEWS